MLSSRSILFGVYSADGAELAVRAVLGQQISVAGARILAGEMVTRCGQPLPEPLAEDGGLIHLVPHPVAIEDTDLAAFAMPEAQRGALRDLARALADGEIVLDPVADREETGRRLVALRRIGPWTASYVTKQALGDPDAFLPTDLGVWRAYAVQHLWAAQDQMPMIKQRETRKEVVA